MKEAQIKVLQSELKKNRNLSYLFLILVLIGVGTTIYFYYQLQKANTEIASKNEMLEKQKAKLENQKKELIALNSMKKQMTVGDSLIDVIFNLVAETNAEIELPRLDDKDSTALEAEILNIRNSIAEYDAGRKSTINKLFSSNGDTRDDARRKLLRDYADDKLLVSDIYEASKGKITTANQEAYWQVVYIFKNLDSELLSPHKDALQEIFQEGDNALLNGADTKRDINTILNRI